MEVPAQKPRRITDLTDRHIVAAQTIIVSSISLIIAYLVNNLVPTITKEVLLVLVMFYLLANAYQTVITNEAGLRISNGIKTIMLAGCFIIILSALKWI